MTQEEIRKDMEEMLGPGANVFDDFPPQLLEHEWTLWRDWMLFEGEIPPKWRDLICFAAAAASGNEFAVAWRVESAKANGATDEEIKEALFCVKQEVGWGAYNNGREAHLGEFRSHVAEAVRRAKEYAASKRRKAERAAM